MGSEGKEERYKEGDWQRQKERWRKIQKISLPSSSICSSKISPPLLLLLLSSPLFCQIFTSTSLSLMSYYPCLTQEEKPHLFTTLAPYITHPSPALHRHPPHSCLSLLHPQATGDTPPSLPSAPACLRCVKYSWNSHWLGQELLGWG